MFERFTDRARRVVVLAQEEARMLNHNYIGTEHLLLGLIHEGEGVAARALEAMGISLEVVRLQVEEIIGQGQEAPSGHIPFTPRAKKVLELSLREATQLGHEHIGTEHILLGLVREGDGVAAQVLVKLGADLNRVRQQVIGLLRGRVGRSPAGEDRPVHQRERARARPADDVLARLESLDERLAAIERWVGMRPGPHDPDQEIARVRREKETAIDAQDFRAAAALRDKEKELVGAKDKSASEWVTGPSLADEAARLSAELGQLRAALRERGIEPGSGVA
jgi:Clp amino terminal domain, pathogenicity island component/UvrB/uvrC motif